MDNQENILDLYYNKHLKQIDIATKVGVSKQYVSKVVKADSRFGQEKENRKVENATNRKSYMKEYFKTYTRPKKENNSYDQLQAQLNQDTLELSYSCSNINDYAFAKWNRKMFEYDKHSSDLVFRNGITTGYNVPKRISNIVSVNIIRTNRMCV